MHRDAAPPAAARTAGRVVPGVNGVFQPTVLVDGEVAGVWRRQSGRGRVTLTVDAVHQLTPTAARRLEKAVAAYGTYLAMPVRLAGQALTQPGERAN